MPDPLPQLPDVARDLAFDVAGRTDLPPFDRVVARANVRQRRRRLAIAGATATVVVSVGVGAALVMLPDQETLVTASPATPSPSSPLSPPPSANSSAERTARKVIEAPGSSIFYVAGSEDGTVAMVWRECEGASRDDSGTERDSFGCRNALAIRSANGSVSLVPLSKPVWGLTAVPGGFLGNGSNLFDARIFAADGSSTPASVSREQRLPRPGDVAVQWGSGPRIYRPSDRTVYEIPAPPDGAANYGGYLTPAGELIVTTLTSLGEPAQAAGWATHDGRRWHSQQVVHGPKAAAGDVAGNGKHVTALFNAVAQFGDDDSRPLDRMLLSHDGGLSWDELRSPDPGAFEIGSIVVTPSGTTLATDAKANVYRVSLDGKLAKTDVPGTGFFTAGKRVYAMSSRKADGSLWWSEDDGLTWQRTSLPGVS